MLAGLSKERGRNKQPDLCSAGLRLEASYSQQLSGSIVQALCPGLAYRGVAAPERLRG